MIRLLMTLAVILCATAAHAQTLVVNPSAVQFQSPSHTDPLSLVAEYEVGFFQGGASPVQAVTLPSTAAVAVAGTNPQAYRVPFSALPSYPAGVAFTAQIRARNTGGTSAWSGASGPFGRPGPPSAPVAPTVVPE